MGSIVAARLAGATMATAAAASITPTAPKILAACDGWTSYRRLPNNLPSRSDAPTPAASPPSTGTPDSTATSFARSTALAPTDVRTPNSCVRCATDCASTPLSPTAARTSAPTAKAANSAARNLLREVAVETAPPHQVTQSPPQRRSVLAAWSKLFTGPC